MKNTKIFFISFLSQFFHFYVFWCENASRKWIEEWKSTRSHYSLCAQNFLHRSAENRQINFQENRKMLRWRSKSKATIGNSRDIEFHIRNTLTSDIAQMWQCWSPLAIFEIFFPQINSGYKNISRQNIVGSERELSWPQCRIQWIHKNDSNLWCWRLRGRTDADEREAKDKRYSSFTHSKLTS